MAVVHLGLLRGDAGFARVVAIKRLHRQYVGDPELSALLLDEARLASRLRHPNVVAPRDLVTCHGEIFVVMEYVHGLTLAALVREARARGATVPVAVVARIMSDVLAGLHAAHEAKDGQGRPLALVHRDVSPQNVMVGADGLARVLDFGIAQAAFRSQTTREGQLRAKLAYAAPEHVLDHPVDRRADVYSSAIVCWELLTLERLFTASNESALLARVLEQAPRAAATLRPEIPAELDRILLEALSKDPAARPTSAEAFALALERAAQPATHREVAHWVASLASEPLERLAARLAEAEAGAPLQEAGAGVAFAPLSTDTRTSERSLAGLEGSLTETRNLKPGWRRVPTRVAVALSLAALVVAPALASRAQSRDGGGLRASASLPAVADPPPPAAATLPAFEASTASSSASPAAADAPQARAEQAAPRAEKGPIGVAPAARPVPRPRASPADDCSQMYEVDANGFRHVKRQCVR
jgi:serine/threonine-protein kinase